MSERSAKRRALVFLPEAAYPVHGGGPLRTACMLEFLRARFELDAVHFRVAGQDDPTGNYPAGLLARTQLIDLPPHSKALLPRLARNVVRAARGVSPLLDRFQVPLPPLARFLQGQQYALAWCEHFWTAPYAALLRRHAARLVVDLHNVESAYFRSAAAAAGPLERMLWERFARVSWRAENEILPQFDEIITTSEQDQRLLPGNLKSTAIPNAIPLPDRQFPPPGDSLAFSGNFAYTPNRAGMAWFAKFVWPQLFVSFPALRLRVIGKEAELVRPLFSSLERVDIVGPISDAVEEIAKSKLAIVPLFVGSGTRLKILEAWAAAAAVISTPLGAAGLGAVDGVHLKLVADPADFVAAIQELLGNEALRQHLVGNGRALLAQRFTWQVAHNLLAELDL